MHAGLSFQGEAMFSRFGSSDGSWNYYCGSQVDRNSGDRVETPFLKILSHYTLDMFDF